MSEQHMTEAQYGVVEQAFITLGHLGGNTIPSPYREGWLALRSVLTNTPIKPRYELRRTTQREWNQPIA